jgi:rRNA small subunit pseudouridine methyltransferase Nep1
MLTLVLADSELEMVPQSIAGHPACVSQARKRGRQTGHTLLDSSVHHAALGKLKEGDRRGRPDLVHFFLLAAQDSILNIEGGLRVVVHTRNGEVINIRPDTRLPKNQARFCSLMEQLFLNGRVPPEGEPLMKLTKGSLQDVIHQAGAKEVVALSPAGRPVDPRVFFAKKRGRDIACMIGGFPDGDFTSPVNELADELISISPHTLKVWTVASEIVVNMREQTKGKRV